MSIFFQILMKMISTELTKTVIAYGVNKLLLAKDDGITKEIAILMIDGIAKSKRNPTTADMLADAVNELSAKDKADDIESLR